jgi:hypothetical protein
MTGKAALTAHYASIGLPASATALVGWFEIGLAVAIAARPATALLLLAAAWKLSSESLWIVSDAPIWEFVERTGSYVAPLALAALVVLDESAREPSRWPKRPRARRIAASRNSQYDARDPAPVARDS